MVTSDWHVPGGGTRAGARRDGGVAGCGAAMLALAVAELGTTDPAAGILAAARNVVLVTALALTALPAVRRDPRVPDLVSATFVIAGTAIDQVAAASRYAPQLVGTGDLGGLHLVAALLIGVAAAIVGLRVRSGAGIVLASLGVVTVVIAGGAVHADTFHAWHVGLLAAQALAGVALLVAPAGGSGVPQPGWRLP